LESRSRAAAETLALDDEVEQIVHEEDPFERTRLSPVTPLDALKLWLVLFNSFSNAPAAREGLLRGVHWRRLDEYADQPRAMFFGQLTANSKMLEASLRLSVNTTISPSLAAPSLVLRGTGSVTRGELGWLLAIVTAPELRLVERTGEASLVHEPSNGR
jgi:hypothetical protein